MDGDRMEALLAAWDDATAPLDVRTREDHAAFLARVGSFRIGCWFAKPDAINAFQCARHGWRNVAPDQLQCTCCKRFLCFKIDEKLSELGAMALACKFQEQLVTGHTELCPWRDNPSPEAFTTLPIATKRQVFETLLSRLSDGVARLREDVKLQKRLDSFSVADAVTSKLYKEASGGGLLDAVTLESKLSAHCTQLEDATVSSVALVNAAFLIVCGWQFDGEDERVLWCGSCNRRWGLPPEASDTDVDADADEGEQGEPPAKRTKLEPSAMDLLAQHRYFCPWVTGRKSSQRPLDATEEYGENDAKLWEFMKLPGWKQYAQAFQLLGEEAESSIIIKPSTSSTRSEISGSNPEDALESVRAVLEL